MRLAWDGCRSGVGVIVTPMLAWGIERDLPRGAPPAKMDVAKLVH